MAASPSFIGTPQTSVKVLTSLNNEGLVLVTGGVSGSLIRRIWVQCVADADVYLTFALTPADSSAYMSKAILLTRTSVADAANHLYEVPYDCLREDVFPGIGLDPEGRFFELGPLETLKSYAHTVDGGDLTVTMSVQIRISYGDY